MKKQLLFVAAIAAGMCATAQDYVKVDAAGLGVGGDEAVALAAGTEVGRTESFIMRTAFDDTYKVQDVKANDCNLWVFDGTEITTDNGFQGQTNPKDADGGNPATTTPPTAPVSGAVIEIEALKDGYVYVWGKLSSHKNYMVSENNQPMGYQLVMQTATLGKLDITVKGSDEYNYVYEPIAWPEVIFTGNPESAVKENGMGVIKFPVFTGCKYLVNATGSKITAGGAWFDAEGDVNIGIKSTETGVSYDLYGAGVGIQNAEVANVVAEEFFTVAGQKASAAATGIVLVKKTFADGSVKTVKVIR